MDSQSETYYAILFDVFDHQGWKQLVREAKEERQNLESQILQAQTWEDTLYLRGRRDQLNILCTLEEQVEAAYETAKQDELEDADS